MPIIRLRVGDQKTDWASGEPVMNALFATVGYRLEPNGKATRFPLLMGMVDGQSLRPEKIPLVFEELTLLSRELRELPPEKAVASTGRAEKIDTNRIPVNRSAQNAYELFVTPEGIPLLDVLRRTLHEAQSRKQSVEVLIGAWTRSNVMRIIAVFVALVGLLIMARQVLRYHEVNSLAPEQIFFGSMISCVGCSTFLFPLKLLGNEKRFVAISLLFSLVLGAFVLFLTVKKII